MKKFEPGKVVITKGVSERMKADKRFLIFVQISLGKHLNGNWGDVSADDKKLNDAALEFGERIFSSYKSGDNAIFIVTEADRSSTTILFPDEY